jgi:hypothetical protein
LTTAKSFGEHTLLNQSEAMAMLRELVAYNLVNPSYVHINERSANVYQLQIKIKYNATELGQFAKTRGLTIHENKEQKYLLIFKP